VFKRVVGRLILTSAVFAGGVWLAWPRPTAGQHSGQPAQAPAPAGKVEFFGTASCASMACHHFNGPKGSLRSEYSTWAAHDKHARAYAVLFNDRSVRMARNLYPESNLPAHQQPLCLKCHSTNDGKRDNADERFHPSDGVGCEACHGPAQKYLTAHYEPGFKGKSIDEKWKKYGLWPTKDLNWRTQLCVSCHVGDGSKEVDHDLIAAGHPRLNFEMGGYHGLYVKGGIHWKMDDERQRYPDFEARLWLLGQLTSMKSALELLKLRADRASGESKLPHPDGGKSQPWPEFSEYNCFACHKGLEVDSPTQRSEYYLKRHPGSFPWGTWYFTMLSGIEAQLAGQGKPTPAADAIKKLRDLMEAASPQEKEVGQQAGVALAEVNKLLENVKTSKAIDTPAVKSMLRTFAQQGQERGLTMDWDQATQTYLGVAAMFHQLADVKDASLDIKGFNEDLGKIRMRLRKAFPAGIDSPRLFDPLAVPTLADQFKALREKAQK